jgi:penicillin-binding protein 1C
MTGWCGPRGDAWRLYFARRPSRRHVSPANSCHHGGGTSFHSRCSGDEETPGERGEQKGGVALSIRRIAYYLGGALLGLLLLDQLAPPDLSRYHDLSMVVRDRAGEPLRIFASQDEQWRIAATPGEVEPRYLELLIAYEDKRFASHFGIDPLAMGRALFQAATRGKVVSGGSTLTMQAARLLEPRPRAVWAKIIEMWRAMQLEVRYSKAEILSIYLTLAPFGGNLEGVTAASLAYFGKLPRQLSLGETALLIALPQSPERRRPDRHLEATALARRLVLERLHQRGALSELEVSEALEERVPKIRRNFPFLAPHLSERLRGLSETFDVQTSLDRRIQLILGDMAQAEGPNLKGDEASLAILVVENKSRAVRGYLGSHEFSPRGMEVDLVQAVRSPGSTLKPFIYGLGFDDHLIHPETMIDDRAVRIGGYAPRNFDKNFHGQMTVREALQNSLNIPAITVLDKVGASRFAATLRNVGMRLHMPKKQMAEGLPLALGGVGTNLNDLVMLYVGLANEGRVRPLKIFENEAPGAELRLMDKRSAEWILRILSEAGRPDNLAVSSSVARRIAYKTGTSYGFRDAWAIGVDGLHTIGVWVGRPDNAARPGHYGRNTAAPLLFRLFDRIGGEDIALPNALDDQETLASSAMSRFQAPANPRLEAPRIIFPADGAAIEMKKDAGGIMRSLPLKAEGGAKPLSWSVNGLPVAPPEAGGEVFWSPDSSGFAKAVVVDAEGRYAETLFRLR